MFGSENACREREPSRYIHTYPPPPPHTHTHTHTRSQHHPLVGLEQLAFLTAQELIQSVPVVGLLQIVFLLVHPHLGMCVRVCVCVCG
jgi:hypothetical protein